MYKLVCTYDEKLRDKKEGKEVILANAWYKRYWSAASRQASRLADPTLHEYLRAG
jgi:hypothetical protein